MFNLIEALANAGIPAPNRNTDTCRMVRWGKNNRYWLRKFEGGYVFGDFVRGISTHVFDKTYRGNDLDAVKIKMRQAVDEIKKEQFLLNKNASERAYEIWSTALPVAEHPYLHKKQILSHGLRQRGDCLLIPLADVAGHIWSLQFIDSSGNKHFLTDGKKKGCFFTIGSLEDAKKVCVCEGYATGATIYECTGEPVVVAFDAGNLKPVVQAIHAKYPELKIIICADNDAYGTTNTGIIKAKEASRGCRAKVIAPKFKDTETRPTDFNDLFVLEGKEAVRATLNEALKIKEMTSVSTQASTSELSNCNGFTLNDEGLFCTEPKTKNFIKISNYIEVIAFTKSDDGEISKLVEFRDHKQQVKQLIITPKMLSKDGDQARILLEENGFIVFGSTFSRRKLCEYLSSSVPEKEVILVSHTGFFGNIYVRPDRIIGNSNEEIATNKMAQDESYAVSGTLQDWNDHVARWCVGNSRLIFAISSGFASILLKPCNMSNFGFHFVGNSSSGKTTCLNVAASVFGTPEYVSTWMATDIAMENMAFRRNDSLLILDELSEISPSKAGEVAYMLANGQGKKRLDKNCNARETLSWRLIFLSSGEVDLDSHMAEERKSSKAGQKIRLLNIPAKASKDSFGIFENLMGFQDGAEFSNYLREKASKYYGTPSIEFIKHVLANQDVIKAQFYDDFQQLKAKYLPEKSEGQDMRAFEKFMFVGFAGELAIKYGVVCWKPGTAIASAVLCFNSWLEDKEGVGDEENRQILEHVKTFFELHGHSRFFDLEGFKDKKVPNMAGYK